MLMIRLLLLTRAKGTVHFYHHSADAAREGGNGDKTEAGARFAAPASVISASSGSAWAIPFESMPGPVPWERANALP